MKTYKISEICDLNVNALNSNDVVEEILYLDTSSITSNTIESFQTFKIQDAPSRARRKVKHNTIIYSTVRPNQKHFGILKSPSDNIIVSTGFTTIDVKEEFQKRIDADFVYFLLTNQPVIDYLSTIAQSAVSAYPSINPDDIGELSFIFPEMRAQKEIVSVLLPIDQKISLNTRINAELEAMAKLLYNYWFVQFDFPNKNGGPYKSSGGKMVYNEKLKREIPEGWEVIVLDGIAEIFNGATPSTSDENNYDGEIVWITPKDLSIQKEKFIIQGERNITQKGYDSCSTHLLPEKSILLSSRAPIGLLAIAATNLCTNQGFKSFVCKKEEMSAYLYYYLQHNMRLIEQIGSGTTFKEVSREDLLKFPVVNPKNDTLQSWHKKIATINNVQLKKQIETEYLTHLRNTLLPMLMNGQVTVDKNMEKLVMYHGTDARILEMTKKERMEYFADCDLVIEYLFPLMEPLFQNELVEKEINGQIFHMKDFVLKRYEKQLTEKGDKYLYHNLLEKLAMIKWRKNGAALYQYGDLYLTSLKQRAINYARRSYAGGELGLIAYNLIRGVDIIGVKGMQPDENTRRAIERVKEFSKEGNERPAIVTLENIDIDDLVYENGNPLIKLPDGEILGDSFMYKKPVELSQYQIEYLNEEV